MVYTDFSFLLVFSISIAKDMQTSLQSQFWTITDHISKTNQNNVGPLDNLLFNLGILVQADQTRPNPFIQSIVC